VPTEVSEELTTVELSVVPVSVPAAAVTVISAEPLNATPLIFLDVVSVAADPVVFWFNVGKSAATAILKAPVVVVLFKMPVARADVPALKSVPDTAAAKAPDAPFIIPVTVVERAMLAAVVEFVTTEENPFEFVTVTDVTVPPPAAK